MSSLLLPRSLAGRAWHLADPPIHHIAAIAGAHALPEPLARLLAARHIPLAETQSFLTPTLRAHLPDPSILTDMDTAATRLARAARAYETVGIFGDYDVDGACAAATLALLLRALGCPVLTYVPDRMTEGYGPNPTALRNLAAQGATLLVCVDCGTTATQTFASAGPLPDILILDHHASAHVPPQALATVNPNRADDSSGLTTLCATAIVFLTAVATLRALRPHLQTPEPNLLNLLDLVALATVCDVMPLTGLNRAFVAQGLKIMARAPRPGIAALLQVAGRTGPPDAAACGYALGPRINAAGRVGESALGLRLLLADNHTDATDLANTLDAINSRRREIEAAMEQEAFRQAEAQIADGHPTLLVAAPQWHQGVVGIVAGRLKERYNRPALVAAIADSYAKGSGRSVPGLNLGAAIDSALAGGILRTGGGHAMACGFSVHTNNLAQLHAFLDLELAAATALPTKPDLHLEATITPAGATLELAAQLERLAPYGHGNPEPMLLLSRARVRHATRVGATGATLLLRLEGEGAEPLKAMLYRAEGKLAAALTPGAVLHFAGHLRAESWNGSTAPCFTVTDASPA